DILLSCVGDLLPLNSFFECNFEGWQSSIKVNSIDQLRVIHGLYPYRNTTSIAKVIFFAGGGVNNAVVDVSAYTAAKIMLIKMCEFLDAENKDISFFSIGPGFLKTKIHSVVYLRKNVSRKKVIETDNFIKTKKEVNMAYLYESLKWLCHQPKEVVGGRNFSLAGDPFRGNKRNLLVQELIKDQNMYKLRRYKNDFLR
ncbi:SDR family oxidoreductase, partial [Candidatus Gottesmanbacteria bacterium]|nr:SDR family oxidoreductase [Candidatus Gottesmanbacteria bacterium]